MEEKIIEFKAIIDRKIKDSENFKIYAVNPTSNQNIIKFNKYNNVSISGDLIDLTLGMEYLIKGKESQWGYNVISIKREALTSYSQTIEFLSEVITEKQAKTLLDVYPNIVQKIIKNDLSDVDFTLLKGIKEKTFDIIKRKVIENFPLIDFIEEFKEYGVTLSTVKKMYDKFSSIERMREKMLVDPYETLCLISGIGFKKADSLILSVKHNEHLKTSLQRMKSCVKYCLSENEDQGNTWISLTDLMNQCNELAPECIDLLIESLVDSNIYVDKINRRIALRKSFETEQYISDTLLKLLKSPKKLLIEYSKYFTIDGCKLSEEQEGVLKNFCNSNISLLVGNAGCVDCDTEYFNGHEWKRIADYSDGEQVLQYNKDGSANLVVPYKYHKYHAEHLWHFSTKYGLDQCLSDEHNVYYITSKNNLYHKSFREVRENHEKTGFLGKFITTFSYKNEFNKLDYNEWMIRLMVAIKADGSFKDIINPYKCHINVKKQRKKDRIEWLLAKNNITYTISNKANGFTSYSFYIPDNEKTYTRKWYGCTKEQFEIIYDEIFYWDGAFENRDQFYTTIKSDADFIQFVGTTLGYRATISTYDRRGRIRELNNKSYTTTSIDYVVSFTTRTLIGMCSDSRPNHAKTPINKYITKDGFKYCFTVESGMLILRRNDKIFITGNSGKSFCTQSIINLCDDNNLSYILMTPTGKSAVVLSNYTNRDAGTIHRKLEYNPTIGWGYNENNKLDCDVVIVDENGMTDIALMKHLLEAIDIDRTRILFVQDDAQLPSVSCGNCAYDMINSSIIPMTRLTKVFRYGEGGLLQIATKIRNGEKYVDNTCDDIVTFGTKGDYSLIPVGDDSIIDYILGIYEKLLHAGNDPLDIMVLTAKNVHENGTIQINKAIQEKVNPHKEGKNYIKYGEHTYRVGDIVIQGKNNYKACNEFYQMRTITNGDVGKIVKIDDINVYVQYQKEVIIYERSELYQIDLAYCISIHRSQGSGVKNVILVTPISHKWNLNKNMMYVGTTRAKEKCFHLSLPSTINFAIKKSIELNRNTFLKDLLINI